MKNSIDKELSPIFDVRAYDSGAKLYPNWDVLPLNLDGLSSDLPDHIADNYVGGLNPQQVIDAPSGSVSKAISCDLPLITERINTFAAISIISIDIAVCIFYIMGGSSTLFLQSLTIALNCLIMPALLVIKNKSLNGLSNSEANSSKTYYKKGDDRTCRALENAGRKNGDVEMYYGYPLYISNSDIEKAVEYSVEAYLTNRNADCSGMAWNRTPMFKALMAIKDYGDIVRGSDNSEAIKSSKAYKRYVRSLVQDVHSAIREYKDYVACFSLEDSAPNAIGTETDPEFLAQLSIFENESNKTFFPLGTGYKED